MTGSYVRVTGPADLLAAARELSVKTMIFDVKPLVAPWHSSQDSLDRVGCQKSAWPVSCGDGQVSCTAS